MPRTTTKSTPVETAGDNAGDQELLVGDPDTTPAAEALVEPVAASAEPAEEKPEPPAPDEFGRYRVLDNDTGHQLSINAPGLPHGNYTVLAEPASSLGGDPLPPVHKTAVETTTDGQQAENKESHDG